MVTVTDPAAPLSARRTSRRAAWPVVLAALTAFAVGCGARDDDGAAASTSTTVAHQRADDGTSGVALPSLPELPPTTPAPPTTTPAPTAPPATPPVPTSASAPPASAAPPETASPPDPPTAAVPPTTVSSSVASADDLPPIPAAIEGYAPYDGVQTETVRVFAGSGLATPSGFSGQMNHCADAFWVARWRSSNPDVVVQGGRAPYDADVVEYEPDPALVSAASTAGYIAGYICERPVLLFGLATNGNGSNLVDVAIEWQYYDLAVQGG